MHIILPKIYKFICIILFVFRRHVVDRLPKTAAPSSTRIVADETPIDSQLLDPSSLHVQDFVLVKVAGKNKVFHYVGQLSEVPQTDILGSLIYLKREKQTGYAFVSNNRDEYEIALADIVQKLPAPIPTGGTARVSSRMIFPVDLSYFANLY